MDFKEEISGILRHILKGLSAEVKDSAAKTLVSNWQIQLEVPPDSKLGDFAFPCFGIAKLMKKNPVEIAKSIAQDIKKSKEHGWLLDVKTAGPYINFFVDKKISAEDTLNSILKKKGDYGRHEKRDEKVMIEYSSPNSNKALHIGHVRNNTIGMAISNIMSFAGYDVVKTLLLNDRGIHICKSIVAFQRWGSEKDLKSLKPDIYVGELYARFEKESQNNPDLEKEAQHMLKKWEAGDEDTLKLWKKLRDAVIKGMKQTYEKTGTTFDKWHYESEFFDQAKPIVDLGLNKGIFKRDEDGSIVADLEQYDLGKKIIMRKDGTSIYITNDLAFTPFKFESNDLDSSVWVVANEQSMYFKQLFKILELLGYKWVKRCHHLSYGMVYLPEGKMSSREGNVINADSLMAEIEAISKDQLKKREDNKELSEKELSERAEKIALAAIKFYMLKVDTVRDLIFDHEKALDFEGETGSYLLYSYARACSILSKAGKLPKKFDVSLFKELETRLADKLSEFPVMIDSIASTLKPHLMAIYAYHLCQAFNEFYHSCQILKDEEELKNSRLLLVECFRQVLENSLALLGIETLERM